MLSPTYCIVAIPICRRLEAHVSLPRPLADMGEDGEQDRHDDGEDRDDDEQLDQREAGAACGFHTLLAGTGEETVRGRMSFPDFFS